MGINKKAGEVISFLNYPEKKSSIIKDIFWYQDSHHLLIEYFDNGNQGIDFIEIDNRLPINKYTLIEKAANFYYELGSNQLYFIKENNLCFIEI